MTFEAAKPKRALLIKMRRIEAFETAYFRASRASRPTFLTAA
jgi:hypothetical protein